MQSIAQALTVGEEQAEIDKLESEIRSWDESISRTEKMISLEPEQNQDETRNKESEIKVAPNKAEEKLTIVK